MESYYLRNTELKHSLTKSTHEMILEICTGTITGVEAARQGGAHRVELCSSLETGGLTPSAGLIEAACNMEGFKKHVLIRPRTGDFYYNNAEKKLILTDIRRAQSLGADGIVVGALTTDGLIDTEFMKACRNEAPTLSLTFHRAFDLAARPQEALEQIIACGFQRVLTSGQAATAEAGIPLLQQLIKQAAGRIIIMPGCGITPSNVQRIIRETGAQEVHASAKGLTKSNMRFRLQDAHMGMATNDEYQWADTSEETVKALKQALSVSGHAFKQREG